MNITPALVGPGFILFADLAVMLLSGKYF